MKIKLPAVWSGYDFEPINDPAIPEVDGKVTITFAVSIADVQQLKSSMLLDPMTLIVVPKKDPDA